MNNMQLRKKRVPPVENLGVYGKVPPQAKELEQAILGAVMLEKGAFDVAGEILSSGCFYVEAHQKIFMAIQGLAEKKLPIDLMTVVEELKNNGDLDIVGGPFAITKLTNAVVSAANIEGHCRIVLQKFMQREMIRISSEIINMAYEETADVFDALDFAESSICNIRMSNISGTFKTLQSVIKENLSRIEDLRFRDESVTGVHSGFAALDKVTCGWQETDLIILAARPSVGKTAFALSLAKNAAKQFATKTGKDKKLVAFFSLEMSDRQLVNRVLSAESGVWLWRLQNGRLGDSEMRQLYRTGEELNTCNILIDQTPALKIQDFKAKARIMVRKHNVGFIVVDYLQLMKDPNKKLREQEISSISSGLKEMAKELQVPIIALSQLNRDFGKPGTGTREPALTDLRESGAIEQDADMVMFLYKPSDEEIQEDKELDGIFYCKIAKHRNGDAPVKFIGKFHKQTQSHEYLHVVDGNFNPVSDWKPAGVNMG